MTKSSEAGVCIVFTLVLLSGCMTSQQQPTKQLPIIDMHLHAHGADWAGGGLPVPLCVPVVLGRTCPEPIWSPKTEDELMAETIAVVERRNIIGVLSSRNPQRVRRWSEAAPGRFIPALMFDPMTNADITPDYLRQLFESGTVKIFGELTLQYAGLEPGDDRMEPYWALAEELDIPVAIHVGEGYPGAPYLGEPNYRARLGSPFLLEDVLVRHPKLRLYVMHYGSPLVDEMIAVLYTHSQVYVDLGGNQLLTYPRDYFYAQLKKLMDAGLGKRIMFGSDQMIWPGVIEPGIAVIEEAPFLSEEQKRDIFYNNAARFLRLTQEEIAKHHDNHR